MIELQNLNVGDAVWYYPKKVTGKVATLYPDKFMFPIGVRFPEAAEFENVSELQWFSNDGRFHDTDKNPTLFLSEQDAKEYFKEIKT